MGRRMGCEPARLFDGKKRDHCLFQPRASQRNGAENRWAELLAQLRRSRADGQQLRAAGHRGIQILRHAQQPGGAYLVCSRSLSLFCRLHIKKIDYSRPRRSGAIGEQHRISRGNILGQFRCPLLPADDFNARLVRETFLCPIGKPRPDTVVPAQSVSAGKKEASGLGGIHTLIVLTVRADLLWDIDEVILTGCPTFVEA